jgi:hypothetical protein
MADDIFKPSILPPEVTQEVRDAFKGRGVTVEREIKDGAETTKESRNLTKKLQFDFESEMERTMVEIASQFSGLLEIEATERKEFIDKLWRLLYTTSFIPLAIVVMLILCERISGNAEVVGSLVAAIIAVPASIIGVFKVISGKLFDNTYRNSLSELLSKYKHFKDLR